MRFGIGQPVPRKEDHAADLRCWAEVAGARRGVVIARLALADGG